MLNIDSCNICDINVYADGKTKAGKPAAGYLTINDRVIFIRSSSPFFIAYDAKTKVQLAFHSDKNSLISFIHSKKEEINSSFELKDIDFLKKV
jgi:hypothetical protein